MKTFLLTIVLAQMMMHGPPTPMTAQQLASSLPGQSVQIEVRVQKSDRASVTADLLQRETDALSKATGKTVELYLPDGTPVIMGSISQVVPGAVLFVYGVVTKPNHVDVKKVIVVTQYVKVE